MSINFNDHDITTSGNLTANSGNFTILSINNSSITGTFASLSGSLDQFANTSSSQLASIISDETGSGSLVFADSPSLTGTPLVPTASSGTNTNQIASTSFVRNEISSLVNSAPSALDTLNELATALGNDANFSTTVTNSLAGKANLSGSSFTGSVSAPTGNFTTLQQNGTNVSVSGHSHVSSDITDFNSSVSGLLPTISNSGDNRILTSTGSSVGINAESNLIFDGTALGIATSSPALTADGAKGIHIDGTTNTAEIMFTTNTASNGTSIYFDGNFGIANYEPNGNLSIATSGTTRFVINSAGNVGIGTTSPNGKLDVVGGRTFLAANNEPYSLGVRYINTGGAVYFGAAGPSATPDAVISNAGGTELIRFTTGGNVGIGTSSPSYKLHLEQSGSASAVLSSFLQPSLTTGNFNQIYIGRTATNHDCGTITYAPNATAANSFLSLGLYGSSYTLNINGNGNIGIGTSSISSGFKVDIRGRLLSYTTASDGLITAQGLQTESAGTGKSAIQIDVNGKGGFAWQNDASSGTRILKLLANNGYGAGDVTILSYGSSVFTFSEPISIVRGTTTGANTQLGVLPENGGLGRDSQILFHCTFSDGWGGADYIARSAGAIRFGASGGSADPRDWSMRFLVADGPAGSDTPRECMRITASGQVLVTAGSGSSGSYKPGLAISGDDDTGVMQTTSGGANTLSLVTDGTERVRVDASGRLGIGISPSTLLHLNSLGVLRLQTGSVTMDCTPTAGATDSFVWNTSANAAYRWSMNGTERVRIESDGKLYAYSTYETTVGGTNRDLFIDSGGLIGYVSSIRASKTNIAAIDDVSWLRDLTPVSFHYRRRNEDGTYSDEADGTLDYGLIAEEVEPVAPEMCFYDFVDGEPQLRGVHYSKLITPMLRYIQQLEQRIAALEERLNHA